MCGPPMVLYHDGEYKENDADIEVAIPITGRVSVDPMYEVKTWEAHRTVSMLYKGPYHVDGLMRLPLVWRPAPSASASSSPAVVSRPVGLVDLAPTFCAIAGLDAPSWMQGRALPTDDVDADARGFERVLTEWDSELFGVAVRLRTITREGWVCTAYLPGTVHDGNEGELYDLADDPLQQVNRWDDPGCAAIRSDLLADLWDAQPPARDPRLQLEAPV